MTWFKVDDSFAFHPKTITLPPAAGWLWVRAGAWCSQQLTDGRFPASMVAAFNATEDDAHALVTAGLWKPTEDGYEFHDWAEYQPSRDQVLAERAASKERQKRARDKARQTRHAVTDAVTHAVTSGEVTADVTPKSRRESRSPRPDPTRPVTTEPLPVAVAPATETVGQRGNRLAKAYTDVVKLSNFPAVAGVVRKAINAGHSDAAITAALGRLAADGRSVTTDTLRVELEGLPPSRFTRPEPQAPGFWEAS